MPVCGASTARRRASGSRGPRGACACRASSTDVSAALTALRHRGIAGSDAFAVGSRLAVPLHDLGARDAVEAIHELGLRGAIAVHRPTLDDVYLRLTGDSLAAAA